MAASYPSAPKSFTTKVDGAGQTIFAAHVNDIQDEVVAVEGGLLNGLAHTLKAFTDNLYDLGTSSLGWRDFFVKRNLTHLGFAGVGAPVVSNASKQLVEATALTNGQVLIGSTGAAPVGAAITAGNSISVTNGPGAITIAVVGSGLVTVLDRKTSTTDVNNTITETDLYNFSVPGNTLGTTKALRFSATGDYLSNSGAGRTFRYRIYYGATVIFDCTFTHNANATRGADLIDVVLFAAGATNAQRSKTLMYDDPSATGTGGVAGAVSSVAAAIHATVAEDSTAAKTFKVTITMSAADANIGARMHAAVLELV